TMEEFLYEVSSENKEVYDEFSQEFDTSIEHEIYDEMLIFDYHSLKNLQKIMTQSIN
ncbi:9971_t:CDS:1, partial [Gigaspora margarita]